MVTGNLENSHHIRGNPCVTHASSLPNHDELLHGFLFFFFGQPCGICFLAAIPDPFSSSQSPTAINNTPRINSCNQCASAALVDPHWSPSHAVAMLAISGQATRASSCESSASWQLPWLLGLSARPPQRIDLAPLSAASAIATSVQQVNSRVLDIQTILSTYFKRELNLQCGAEWRSSILICQETITNQKEQKQ